MIELEYGWHCLSPGCPEAVETRWEAAAIRTAARHQKATGHSTIEKARPESETK